jgi:transcriptional regulator with XRE-family HTH domain
MKKNYKLLSSSQIETDLGKQIREIRLSRNISQKQLATLAGISPSSIYRFESGNGISLDNFIRILKGLGLETNLEAMLPDPTIIPIEIINRKTKKRLRASTKEKPQEISKSWKWGDQNINKKENK